MPVDANPAKTASAFLRTKSDGLTPAMAATGMTAQGIRVPPPTQTVMIWPKAARDSFWMGRALAKVAAVEPTRGRPEKPEPSRPVTAATAASQRMTGPLERGTF